MKTLLLTGLILLFTACAFALPTPENTTLSFDDYTDPKGIGFFVYYVQPNQAYSDQSRVDILRPEPETIQIRDFLPMINGTICTKVTAYDIIGQESEFSNESCGWFGIDPPNNNIIGGP